MKNHSISFKRDSFFAISSFKNSKNAVLCRLNISKHCSESNISCYFCRLCIHFTKRLRKPKYLWTIFQHVRLLSFKCHLLLWTLFYGQGKYFWQCFDILVRNSLFSAYIDFMVFRSVRNLVHLKSMVIVSSDSFTLFSSTLEPLEILGCSIHGFNETLLGRHDS